MQTEMNSPATVGAVNRANIEAANFSMDSYTDLDLAATLKRQIALIRGRFGATDHLAANLAALAFGELA